MPVKKRKKYKRVVDNRMRGFGDIDFEKRVIRINKKRSQTVEGRKAGGVIDSIVHEEKHRLHPRMGERRLKKEVRRDVKRMSGWQKAKLYARYRK